MSIEKLKRFVACASLAVALLTTTQAPAATLTILHEGNGSGTLDGNPFTLRDFLITAVVDTADRQSFGGGFWIDHTSASISIDGVGDVDFLTDTRHLVNNGAQIVGFSRAGNSGADLFNGPLSALFGTWDMLSPIGPISGIANLLQWTDGPVNTTGGVLVFSNGGSNTIFTVIPEPASLALLVVGGKGLMVRRRR